MVFKHKIGVVTVSKSKIINLVIALVLLASQIAPFGANLGTANAAGETVVTQANFASTGWTKADTRPGGSVSFVTDATALGNGALQLTTNDTDNAKAQLLTGNHVGVSLTDITALSYQTKHTTAASAGGAPTYQLGIDADGDIATGGDRGNLVFEPYWQNDENPDAAPVVNGEWQDWNVKDGLFWSSANIAAEAGNVNGGLQNGAGGAPFYTLAEVIAKYPNAKTTTVGVNIGSYNRNYVVSADNLTFNETTYDFEPLSAPSAAAQTSQTVLQSDFANAYTTWTYHDDTAGPANAATPTPNETHKIVANPTPVTGNNGAVRLNTAAGEKWNLASLQYSGTKLRDISALGFSAYTSNPGSAYVTLDVDFNYPGTSGYQGRLVYVPTLVANTWGNSEAVASNGQWRWSTSNTWQDGVTATTRSWNEIINAFPEATITAVDNQAFGSLYLRSDGASTTYFDNVYLATSSTNVKYNFELVTPGTPQNLTPLNGTVTNDTAFTNTWSPVDGAVAYEYRTANELDDEGELGTIVYSDSSATAGNYNTAANPVTRANNNTPENNYFWQVRAINAEGTPGAWSVINKVTVDTQKPSTPTNGLPNGTFKNTNDFYFTWNESTDSVGPITYEFQSSGNNTTNPDGSLVGAWNSIANGNSEQNNLTTPTIHSTGAGDGTYFWQVRAIDAAGNKSDWSETWSMSIDTIAPAVPQNLRMVDDTGDVANNGTTNSYDIDAMWDTADGANGYIYKYWNGIEGNPYKEASPYVVGVSSNVNPGQFNQGFGDHYFAVKSVDAAGNESAWSAPYKITYAQAVVTPPTEEPTDPTDPTDPADDEDGTDATEGTIISAVAAPAAAAAPTAAFFQNIATVFNNDGTVSALTAPTGETIDQDGQVLGAEDSLAKNAAQADTTTDDFKLLGFAWYWVIAALAALLAGWWLIAGYRRRKDEQA